MKIAVILFLALLGISLLLIPPTPRKLPITKIVVAFGYKDTRPSRLVGDRYERAMLVEKLVKLGFKRNDQDDDLLDLETADEHFQIKVFNASVGPDDQENRMDPYQAHQSSEARRAFLSALNEAGMVLYNGHSRDGGGPDFSPPLLLSNGHVDYPRYRHERNNALDLFEAWKKSPNRARQLGLISCYSEQHFYEQLKKTSAEATRITTIKQLIYYTEALQMIFDLISERINRR